MALKNFSASLSLSKGCPSLDTSASGKGQGFDKLSQAELVSSMLVGN